MFGGAIPNLNDDKARFSYAWAGGNTPKDHTPSAILGLSTSNSVKEYMDYIDDIGKDGYNGMGFNLVLADNQGNIGYMLQAALPVRKD